MESTGRWSISLGSLNSKCHYEYQEIYPTLDPPLYLFIPVVLKFSSIEPQGFVESVSGVRQRYRILRLFPTIPFFKIMCCWFCSLNTGILCATDAWVILCTNKIYTYVLKNHILFFKLRRVRSMH